MPEPDELDRLIDAELARYGEPRIGLEQRILAHVKTQSSHRSWLFHGWQRWALAGAVAMVIVLAIAISRLADHNRTVITAVVTSEDHAPVRPMTTGPEVHVQTPYSKHVAKTFATVTHRSKSAEVSEPVRQPKLEVFPAPQPLSAQEQNFLQVATHLPGDEREKLLEDQKGQGAALEVSSIRIPPITMPALGN